MKKIVLCITLSLLFAGAAFAQRDLACYPVFQGKIVPGKQMVVTEVRGGNLVPYKLDYYRGVSFQVDAEMAVKVARLVDSDALDAKSAETERIGEFLTYALLEPQSSGSMNRYLCYQARRVGDKWKVTLLYLEGPATLEDLRSVFDKQ